MLRMFSFKTFCLNNSYFTSILLGYVMIVLIGVYVIFDTICEFDTNPTWLKGKDGRV
jgi:hypothetical protein